MLAATQDCASHGADEMDEGGYDGDDDDLGFWGGGNRGLPLKTTHAGEEMEDDDEDDFDNLIDDNVLDGGDEEDDHDHMEIFGHR